MRSRYKIYGDYETYFVTSTIIDWISVFQSKKYYDIMIETIKFYQEIKNLLVHAYVLLPNHFHMVISNENVSKIMQSLKKYTAREIIKNIKADNNATILKRFRDAKPDYKITSKHQVWQESFHPQQIISYKMLNQKIDYIHFNPVKKKLVEKPEDWEYSSAIDYYTDRKGLIEIVKIL